MRINSVQQSDAISKYLNNVSGSPAKVQNVSGISDSVELSEGAQKFSSLMKEAKVAMEKAGIDEEVKVADIMARMNNNSYNVSNEDVLDGIMSGIPKNI